MLCTDWFPTTVISIVLSARETSCIPYLPPPHLPQSLINHKEFSVDVKPQEKENILFMRVETRSLKKKKERKKRKTATRKWTDLNGVT